MTQVPTGEPENQPARPTGAYRNGLAWLVIVACSMLLVLQGLPGGQETGSEKPFATAASSPQMDILLRLANGLSHPDMAARSGPAALFGGGATDVERVSKSLGPGGELTGAVVLARFGNTDAAVELLDGLQGQIEAGDVIATPEFSELLNDVRTGVVAVDEPRADALTGEARARLVKEMGTAGETLVAMATGDQQEIRTLAENGLLLVLAGGTAVCFGIFLGLIGVVMLVVFTVQAVRGRLVGPGPTAGSHAPVYAEMFAVWMVAFVGLNRLPRLFLATHAPGEEPPITTEWQLVLGLAGMAIALAVALAYARIRGLTWREIRADCGLANPSPTDFAWGIVGYMMGIALLGVGLVVTMVLLALFAGEQGSMPSHPVQEWLQSGGSMAVLLTFAVASIAAPITEEIVFRGAMYRNLRDTFGPMGGFMAAAISTVISSVIFAAIHPQGLFFIPVLASLAVAFCLMREWRGSIYPGIWAHAINNTLILGLNVILLRY